ncbi:MAG: diaminopimelate epimerase, partial [uncultured bacterium]
MSFFFTKMQGLGNDFIVIDAVRHNISLSIESIRKIADRHFGIGCDQVLILKAPTENSSGVDFSYRIFNADGGEAGFCGNGIRCLAKFALLSGLTKKRDLVFSTKTCTIKTHLEADGLVGVLLSSPIFEPKDIPFVAKEKALRYNLQILGYDDIEIGVVGVGNPHAVVMCNDCLNDNLITDLGPLISNNERFPERVNVDFMRVLSRDCVELRVYERGSGETLACGSGACACVVVGNLWGVLDSVVRVKLLGGDL